MVFYCLATSWLRKKIMKKKQKKYLITGGTGFIGSNISRYLVKKIKKL